MRLTEGQVSYSMGMLPERFLDRLTEQELQHILRDRNAGEWGLTVLNLIATLHQNRVTISAREAQSLRDYLETFETSLGRSDSGMDLLRQATRWLDDLRVIPSLTDEQMRERMRTFGERFRGRIPDEKIEWVVVRPEDEEPGVWFETMYDLMEELLKHRVTITEQERNELWMLLDALNMSRKELIQLPVS
jgi:hypothetical protein